MLQGNSKVEEQNRKKCKHCKKNVASSLDCVICASSYHPSCAFQAKVANSDSVVICCTSPEESEVKNKKSILKQDMDEKKIKNMVKDLFNEYLSPFKKIIQSDIGDLKKSVQYMSDSFDDQKVEIKNLLSEIKQLKDENTKLSQRVQILEDKINQQEQKEKENNIVVTGIPKQDQDLKVTVCKIVETMKVQISENEIQEVYQINKREGGPIVLKLTNRDAKQKIINRVKQLKGIRVQECGLDGGNKSIYFNDDLTRQNQLLFKKTREIRREKGFRAAYVTNGKIYLKKKRK